MNANKITKGNIVKFTDPNGLMNGGTVVEFTRKDNEEFLLINTLDDKRILKRKSEVIPIKRQQRGRISAKFMEDLKEEIKIENENLSVKELQISEEQISEEQVSEEQVSEEQVKESISNIHIGIKDDGGLIGNLRSQLVNKDLIISKLKEEVKSQSKRIDSLEKQLHNPPIPENVANLSLTVKGLSDALLACSINKEGDMVQELLKVIAKLNHIE